MTSIKVMGIELKFFAIFTVLVLSLTFFGKLPLGMAGAVPLLMVVGAILGYVGDRMPIIKDYFGGGAIVILFGSASLVLFQILPKPAIETVGYFMNRTGFLDFALATLITGSLFGTDRKTLLAACLRYVPAIIAAQIVGLIAVAAMGALIGYGWKQAILYIGLPAMGGGIAAGAIPMSKMFGEAMKQDPKTIFSTMVSAVALANAMAILGGGLMDRIGQIKPEWTGNGKLLAVKSEKKIDEDDREDSPSDIKQYGVGILVSLCVLFAGYLVMKFVPTIHAYAWMVIIAVLIKISGILPKTIEDAGFHWSQLCVKNFLGMLLAGLGIAMVDLQAVLNALSLNYVILVGTVVISSCVAASVVGKLIGFNPIESGITVGLCSTDMGGSGDLAILSASKRMELLPFASISTRIGGALILILSGFLLTVLL